MNNVYETLKQEGYYTQTKVLKHQYMKYLRGRESKNSKEIDSKIHKRELISIILEALVNLKVSINKVKRLTIKMIKRILRKSSRMNLVPHQTKEKSRREVSIKEPMVEALNLNTCQGKILWRT